MAHLVAHFFGVAYFKRHAGTRAVHFQRVGKVAVRAFYFFDFVVVGVGWGIGVIVGGGHAEQVGEYLRVVGGTLKLEADGAALQVG